MANPNQTTADIRRDQAADGYDNRKQALDAFLIFKTGYDYFDHSNNEPGLVCICKVLKARSQSHPGYMSMFNINKRLFLLSHLEVHHPGSDKSPKNNDTVDLKSQLNDPEFTRHFKPTVDTNSDTSIENDLD